MSHDVSFDIIGLSSVQDHVNDNEVSEINRTNLLRLRVQLIKLGTLGVIALMLSALSFQHLQMTAIDSLYWLLLSLCCWGITCVAAWRLLNQNRPSETTPLWTTIGVANQVTLLRGVCISGVGELYILN